MDIAMIGLTFSVVATVAAGGWVILHNITSQLSALRLELENKIETGDNRLNGRIQQLEDRMDGRMQQLEDRMDGRMQQLEDRMDGRMQQLEDRMEGRMQKLEDGQTNLGRQIARLEGMLSLRRPSTEEPQPA